ncbi:MAG: ion transporter [Acidobacteriota bacterium]
MSEPTPLSQQRPGQTPTPRVDADEKPHLEPWRAWLHEVIFEADTPVGKAFDVALMVAIVASVIAVMLESVASIRGAYGGILRTAEWAFTILFSIEYLLRLISLERPARYARSFFGVVDLLAVIPTYLSLVVTGTQSLIVIRALRLLRVFRVLKLAHYVGEQALLYAAIRASARKIVVFLGIVLAAVLILGASMYLIEGEENGFTSIPISMYWAIVTMTTVGYGDIAPQTVPGKFLAAAVMVLGYGVLAVPTGIVTVELAGLSNPVSTRCCPSCGRDGHAQDALFCKYCSAQLRGAAEVGAQTSKSS